jgi:hypothetical protein
MKENTRWMVQQEFSFILSRKSMFLLCLKNPLLAYWRRSKCAVGQNRRRWKISSVKIAVDQKCHRTKWPSVKIVVDQSCVGQKTWNLRLSIKSRKCIYSILFYGHKYGRFFTKSRSQECKYPKNAHLWSRSNSARFNFSVINLKPSWIFYCFKTALKLKLASKKRCFSHNSPKIQHFRILSFDFCKTFG